MIWSPGKLVMVKWDGIPSGLKEASFRIVYDLVFKLTSVYPYKKSKYVFTSLHLLRLLGDQETVFNCAGREEYRIDPGEEKMEIELLALLVERTHLLFNEEFEKMKKGTAWEKIEIPDYDLSLVKDELKKLTF